MLSRPPTGFRDVDEETRVVNTKKVYSRRPWYAPPIDPAEVLREEQYNNIEYETDTGEQPEQGDYYDPSPPEYDDPVTSKYSEIREFDPSPANPVFEESPTSSSVTGFSIADAVNLREAALVALGGASAALVLLIIMAGVFVARRRKNSPSPVPSPPILVYPPHDIAGPCYMTKEVNFSLPALRSSSLGELRDVVSVNSLGSEILCPPIPTQIRSNSFSKSQTTPF